MNYYKITTQNQILLSTSVRWLIYDPLAKKFVPCFSFSAHAIQVDNDIFYLNKKPAESLPDYPIATLEEISESEYNYLKAEQESSILINVQNNTSFLTQRATIINNLSEACEQAIYKGFDIELSDGLIHHFSFEITDQLAINYAFMQIQGGAPSALLHADGELYQNFSAADIQKIYNRMIYKIQYETTYFNSLKVWINNLRLLTDIQKIKYGDVIPEGYQTEAFKQVQRTLI